MERVAKILYAIDFESGETRIVSTDKRQMARWYALDYLKDKPQLTDKGYMAVVSEGYYFTPTFRKRK